jgi:hypothetical protein
MFGRSSLKPLSIQQPNKAPQTDKVKLSCLLHSQKPRQLAFAAELGRYAAQQR